MNGALVPRLLKRLPWIVLGAAGTWFYDGAQGADRRRRLKSTVTELFGPPSAPETGITIVDGMRDRAA